MQTRRQFVAALPALVVAASTGARCDAAGSTPLSNHPTPRPGVTAAKVLSRKQLGDEHADAARVFDMVREIPHIVDGIRCRCGCADLEGNYSLLSCYEGDGMAGHCEVCQGEARLAHRLFKQGKSLTEIRAAIDAKFG